MKNSKEYARAYYLKNKEKWTGEAALERSRKYRQTEGYKKVAKENRKTASFKKSHRERVSIARFRRKYGLTPQDRQEMIDVQGNACAICGSQFENDKKNKKDPCIDHNHTTGKLRGMLCRRCNLLLGYAKDSQDVLSKAISYLKQYED